MQNRFMSQSIRSPILTIFWHCDSAPFSSRTALGAFPATNRQRFCRRISRPKGLAMSIRSGSFGVRKEAAVAVRPCAPAASLPTLHNGGRLLLSRP